MRQIQDRILFIEGKLNSDIDIELLPKGDHPVDPTSQMSGRLNLIMQEGNKGILTNVKGTTATEIDTYIVAEIVGLTSNPPGVPKDIIVDGDITSYLTGVTSVEIVASTNNDGTYSVLSVGLSGSDTRISVSQSIDDSVIDGFVVFAFTTTSKILRTVYDNSANCMYLLIYNADGYHNVQRLNNDGTLDLIYSNSLLNFQENELIHNIGIIGSGAKKQICWTSTDNPPRCLNISRAENIEYELTEDFINLIRTPPLYTLSYSFINVSNGINNIYNKTYQFCYKYVYFDGKESSWSEYTDVVYNVDNESINGIPNNDIEIKNGIQLSQTNVPSGVTKIKIGYRFGDDSSGTPSVLYLYDVIDITGTSFTYNFLDNKIKSGVDTTEGALKAYEVPEYATDLEILNDNRIALVNPTLGKDLTDITVSLQAAYADNTSIPLTVHASTNVSASGGTGDITIATNTNEPYVEIISLGDEDEFTEIVRFVVGDNSLDYSYQLVEKLNEALTGHSVTASRIGVNQIRITNSESFSINVYRESLQFIDTYPSVKAGATHYLGIEYSDGKGRTSRVNISTDSQFSMPWWHDIYNLSNDGYSLGIIYEISHNAPSWATTWQWVYAGNNIESFYQIVLSNGSIGGETDITFSGGNIVLDVQQADDRILARNPNYASLITFDAAVGDKVRFKSKIAETDLRAANSRLSDSFTYFTNYIELEIIDVDPTTGALTLEGSVSSSEFDDIVGNGSYNDIVVEVLSYSKDIDEDNLIYQAIGKKLTCSGGYHNTSTPSNQDNNWMYETNGTLFTGRNQTVAQTGLGIIEMFDVYNRYSDMYVDPVSADFSTIILAYLESKFSSLVYDSQKTFGKINYVDAQAEQREVIGVAYSGTYSETGLIFDELNKFEEDGVVEDIPNQYGQIKACKLVGNSLKLFQTRKIVSVWNNKQEIYNQDGTVSIVALQNPLGSPNVLDDEFGCIFPQAIAKKDRFLYYPDIYSGKVLRNAPNGNEEISRYGMEKFFRIRFKDLLDSGVSNLKVSGVFDYVTGMYLLSVEDTITSSNSFMVGFEEASNSWKTFFSGNYDLFDRIGDNRTFGFEDDTIYEFYTNSLRNYFKGVQYTSYVTIVSNEGTERVFESIHINSNDDGWGSPENDDILIHEDGNTYTDSDGNTRHKIKMQSRLKSGLFRFLEGLFKCDYLRNMISSSSTPSQSDLYKGDVLRGRYLKQRLENSSTSEVHLRDVTINSSISKGN